MDPYLAQIFMFGGNFAPKNYSYCNGSILAISQYSALFSLLGNVYGGDARSSFALPDLRGRMPISPGSNNQGLPDHPRGQMDGSFRTTLSTPNLPSHTHASTLTLSGDLCESTTPIAEGTIGATLPTGLDSAQIYSKSASPTQPALQSPNMIPLDHAGGGGQFTHYAPIICIPSIICTVGLYPSQN